MNQTIINSAQNKGAEEPVSGMKTNKLENGPEERVNKFLPVSKVKL